MESFRFSFKCILIIILLSLQKSCRADLRIRMMDQTIINHNTFARVTNAIKQEHQNQPFISDTNKDHVQVVLDKLNTPRGRVGDKCSREYWTRFIQPLIMEIVEGNKEEINKLYKSFAHAAIEDEDVVENVCLSQYFSLECSPETETCVCLKINSPKVDRVSCGVEKLKLGIGVIALGLALAFGNYNNVVSLTL